MAIPDYQTIMLPLLKSISDGQSHSMIEVTSRLAKEFGLTLDELKELLPSGRQTTFTNRVGWARTYLKKAGLLTAPARGLIAITDRGLHVLRQKPEKIDVDYLMQFSEFQDFKKRREPTNRHNKKRQAEEFATPEEIIEQTHASLQDELADEILERIKAAPPEFFENLVVDLLVAMGYGGSRRDAGKAIGHSGDEGIDGIINEDKLGLDVIYIQAKRWDNTVGRPVVQGFAGALEGFRANRGILLTTSEFSSGAREYVRKVGKNIVLIDGRQLARLMIEHNVGVTRIASYDLKRIDNDYFIEE